MILRRILFIGLSLLLPLGVSAIEFSERDHSKRFVLKVEKPGNLMLELKREYRGKQRAELMYLYDDVQMRWEQNGDLIELYRLPAYPDRGEEELAFVLRYEPQTAVLTFEAEGILEDPSYFEFFEGREWQSANERSDPGYKMYYLTREQPKRFYKIKSKGAFPEETPAVLMNVAARLFRDRVHELRAPLMFPSLDEATLRVVAEAMFNQEFDQNTLLQPLVAAHPNTPKDLRDRFFESDGQSYKTQIWRAVALRDDEPDGRYQEYLRRIKEGETIDRHMVARDRDAPKEAWELAIAPGEREVLKEFSRNPNAPSEMIMQLFKSGALQHDARGMASNAQTPPAVLEALSNTEDKQILRALQRNPSTPAATVQQIIAYLGNSVSAGLRGQAARDERAPVELLEALSQDVNINVRTGVAMNQRAPLQLLEQLAEDTHQTPASRARETLMRNYKEVYDAQKDSWTAIDQLNPHNNLSQELNAAIKAGDQETARKLIRYTEDPETRLDDMEIVWAIQNNSFEDFRDLFKEALLRMNPKMRVSVFSRDQFTPEQLRWGIDEGVVTPDSIQRIIGNYSKKGRTELIEVLEEAGLIDSVDENVASECLVLAVARRNLELTKFWLSKGGDPTLKIWENLSALDVARRFHSLSILELIDEEGSYSDFIEEIRREFPKPTNGDYVGVWSNQKDGFGASSMNLLEDGTGSLGASIMSLTVLWKEVREDTIEIAIVDPDSGKMVEERMQFVLTAERKDSSDGERSVSMLKAMDKDHVYYRIPSD